MMQFCQEHWDDLRIEIAKAGLADAVSKDGAEAVRRFKTKDADPLLEAHNIIMVLGAKRGLVEGCPVCHVAAESGGVTDAEIIRMTVENVKERRAVALGKGGEG
ncbi:MAG: hypothetical protein WC683_04370 [bacterium]